jgi:hypothetical protein
MFVRTKIGGYNNVKKFSKKILGKLCRFWVTNARFLVTLEI